MKIIEVIHPKDSEVYCILYFSKPVKAYFGKELGKFMILGWPYHYIKESSLLIEEEFPKTYLQIKPAEILHGVIDNYSNDPLNIRIKTLTTFIIRFKIIDFFIYKQTIESREKLVNHIQSSIISITQQQCIKNSLAHNLRNIEEINDAVLKKAIELTEDFGIKCDSIDVVIKLSPETNELLNKYSKARVEGFSSVELEKALYYAKGQGISKLQDILGLDNAMLIYKIEKISESLKKNNYNFYSLSDQDKDITQKVLSIFHSSQQV